MNRSRGVAWIISGVLLGIALMAVVILLTLFVRSCGRQTSFQETLTGIPAETENPALTATSTATLARTDTLVSTVTPVPTATVGDSVSKTPLATLTISVSAAPSPTTAIPEEEEKEGIATVTPLGAVKTVTPRPTKTPVPGGNPDAGYPP